jgi:hypothetical protein
MTGLRSDVVASVRIADFATRRTSGSKARSTSTTAMALTLAYTILGQTDAALDICRQHEMVHVRQFERWGPLMGPAYLGCSLALCRSEGRGRRDAEVHCDGRQSHSSCDPRCRGRYLTVPRWHDRLRRECRRDLIYVYKVYGRGWASRCPGGRSSGPSGLSAAWVERVGPRVRAVPGMP